MLRLLKRVRRKLIREGNVKQFLLYATSEIFLVVIGIVIALQIDSLYTEIENEKKEKQILSSLKSDLQKDIHDIDSLIHRASIGVQYGDSIFYALNTPNYSSYKFYSYLAVFTKSFYFTTSSGSFDQANSTGTISLISSESLRISLFEYYTIVKSNFSDESSLHTYREIFGKGTINEIVPTKEFALMNGKWLGLSSLENNKLPSVDLEELSGNKEFNAAILVKTSDYQFQLNHWNGYKSKADLILNEIQAEIKRLE